MKNPHRRRTLWISVVVGGLASVPLPFFPPEIPAAPWLFPTLFGAGLMAVIFGSLFAGWAQAATRRVASISTSG